jgi:thiol peroxidase
MRSLLLVCVCLAACSKTEPVDRAHVVDYLQRQPPAARAEILATVSAPAEHVGVIHRGDKDLTLLGDTLDVGADLPDVTLAEMVEGKMATLELGSLRGKLIVLSVVPSIDTLVCEAQTHAVSNAIAQMPPDTVVITVSRDLPFAQARFAEEAMTQTRMASDYHGGGFGRAFGLEVKESGLLARSTWIIGRDGKIAYRDLVDDQGDQPDYDALVAAASRIGA